MSTIWLGGLNDLADGPGRPMTMPVFAGQKLVVVGGSSGMGRQAAADVVADATKSPPRPCAGPATRHTGRHTPATPRPEMQAITIPGGMSTWWHGTA